MRPLLNVKQVCLQLGVHRSTVYRLIERGELSPVRVGAAVRFRPEDIEAYVQRQSAQDVPGDDPRMP